MAEHDTFNMESIKAELNSLRSQFEKMVKNLEEKKDDISSETAAKIARELEHYRSLAADRAQHLYAQGQAGLEEVGAQVRKNPLASLAIAFGAGYVVSCLFKHLK